MIEIAASTAEAVLLVGRDLAAREDVRRQLSEAGLRVLPVCTGTEALEQATNAKPDLVLLESILPDLDGFEVCRRLRSCDTMRDLPVIFLYPPGEMSSKVAAFEAGGIDCISVPFPIDELLARVQAHLEIVRSRARLAKLSEDRMVESRLISERLRLELAERKKTERRFATMFDACPLTISIAGLEDGLIVDVNRALVSMLGYSREELVGRTSAEFGIWTSPGDRERIVQSLKRGMPVSDVETVVRTKDGRAITTLFTGALVELDDRVCLMTIGADVTERKAAQESLRKSEQRFATVFQVNPAPMAIVRKRDMVAVDINDAFVKLFGYAREDCVGRSSVQSGFWADPQDRQHLEAALRAEGSVKNRETQFRAKDGRLLTVLHTVEMVELEDEPCFLSIFSDITERKCAEEVLKKSEQQFATIFRANPLAISIVRMGDGRIVDVNEAHVRLFGHTREETIGRTPEELRYWVDPEDRERMRAEREAEGRVREWEIRLRAKDGRILTVMFTVEVIEFEGEPCRLCLFSNITERHQAEEILKKSEQRFATLFRANPAPLSLVKMSDSRFLDINEAHIRLFGGSREEVIGHTAQELGYWLDLEERAEVMRRLRSEGFVHNRETRFRTRDGRLITTLLNMELVELDGELFRLCLFADITERKRDEEERARLEAQLQQAKKLESVGRLAGGVAHDFNNLLTIINGYSMLLLKSVGGQDPTRSQVEQIRKAGERATALTQQLLAFSRKQMIQPKPINLNEVVAGTETMLRRLVGEDIELRTALDPSLGVVMADPGQIDQILMNLAANARDAMPKGGWLSIETANVEVGSSYEAGHVEAKPGAYVLVTVSDNGAGIDAETQQHIFEPFFTTKERGRGTGLGLATVYGIVKQSGGWISVYSEPGLGTSFKIYFPRTTVAGQTLELREVTIPELNGSETVLVVEDQEEVRALAVTSLRGYGYRVVQASNGLEALEALKKEESAVAVMVTDVVLPGMNGRELADRVRVLRPEIKTIYTSGYTESAIVERGVLAEGVEFLPKPYSPAALAARIRKVLG